MLIGELAQRTGVSRRSLRYYEQHGLLRARRGPNGWRDYEESAVHRVRTIARMLGSGLTVAAIKQLEPCLDRDELADCDNPDLAIEIHRARLALVDIPNVQIVYARGRPCAVCLAYGQSAPRGPSTVCTRAEDFASLSASRATSRGCVRRADRARSARRVKGLCVLWGTTLCGHLPPRHNA
jgi:DNA-binding transcriptional MerR regulator